MDCIADLLLGGMDCMLAAVEEDVAVDALVRILDVGLLECALMVRSVASYETKVRRARRQWRRLSSGGG